MIKRVFFTVLLALVLGAVLPVRLAAKLPEFESHNAQTIAESKGEEELSLARLLLLSGDENLYAASVYVYGLPTDALAQTIGVQEPTRITLWLDGVRPIGVTTTYQGAGEYYDLHGRSAAQLDGQTDQQYLQSRQQNQQMAEEKLRTLSQNIHNYIMNVDSWN